MSPKAPQGRAPAQNPSPVDRDRKRRLPIAVGWLLPLTGYYLAAAYVTHLHKLAGAAVLLLGLLVFHRPLRTLLREGMVNVWREINAKMARARADQPPDHFDYRPLVVMCTAALSLTLIQYFGDRDVYDQLMTRFLPRLKDHRFAELGGFVYWSVARQIGYIGIPFLAVLFMPGERIRDYGLTVRDVFKHVWIYGLLFAIVLPAVIMVSFTPAFQTTYPFYKLAARSWTDFLIWELAYGAQFFALEVFFRGFMLHALKRPMGAYAIFAMIVPYCMIHYHKPLPETLGAVAAGLVLGTLSLHTGSIWCGWLIHVSVALSMDWLAMLQTAGYPGNPRFVGR